MNYHRNISAPIERRQRISTIKIIVPIIHPDKMTPEQKATYLLAIKEKNETKKKRCECEKEKSRGRAWGCERERERERGREARDTEA